MDIKEWLPSFNVAADTDQDLHRYFIKTDIIQRIIEKKWLVLGRKGTGKTALYEYFKSAPLAEIDQYHTLSLNFEKYPWPIHQLYHEPMEGRSNAFQRSWKYLLIVQALNKLIAIIKENGQELTPELKSADRILRQLFDNPFPSTGETIKAKFSRLAGLSGPSVEMVGIKTIDISFEQASKDETLRSILRTNAFTLLEYLERILKANIGDYKILLTLDRLDEEWLPENQSHYPQILTALILAAQSLNLNGFRNKLRVVVFLRTDIFESLHFNNKNVLSQDSGIQLFWDEKRLSDMLWQRIATYKPEGFALNAKAKDVNSIVESPPSEPFKFLLKHTFYRPRDVISFMNQVREAHTTSTSGLYTAKDIKLAVKSFSIKLYDELLDEWRTQKPEIEQLLLVLQNLEYQDFAFTEFQEKYLQVLGRDDKATVENELAFLFQNSILGQRVGKGYVYVCTSPYLPVNYQKPFQVNPGLWFRLNLSARPKN